MTGHHDAPETGIVFQEVDDLAFPLYITRNGNRYVIRETKSGKLVMNGA